MAARASRRSCLPASVSERDNRVAVETRSRRGEAVLLSLSSSVHRTARMTKVEQQMHAVWQAVNSHPLPRRSTPSSKSRSTPTPTRAPESGSSSTTKSTTCESEYSAAARDCFVSRSSPTQDRLSVAASRSVLPSRPRFHMSPGHTPAPLPPLADSHAHVHAGGKKVLLAQAGKDATEKFWQFHSKLVLQETAKPYCIGRIGEAANADGVDFEDAVIHKIEDDDVSAENTAEQGDEPEDSSYFGGASLSASAASLPPLLASNSADCVVFFPMQQTSSRSVTRSGTKTGPHPTTTTRTAKSAPPSANSPTRTSPRTPSRGTKRNRSPLKSTSGSPMLGSWPALRRGRRDGRPNTQRGFPSPGGSSPKSGTRSTTSS